jgi:ABC-type Na+ efflux pump permease subunit
MRLWKSWIVATKDFSVFRKNRYVFLSLIAIPLIVGSIMAVTLFLSFSSGQVPLAAATLIVNLAAWYLVVIASILPTVIASYSFVGEKIEKSLEPLLATPTTDSELLLGKSLAAFLPCIGATYGGAAISAVLIDSWSYTRLRAFLIPNWDWAMIVAIITPLACILSV